MNRICGFDAAAVAIFSVEISLTLVFVYADYMPSGGVLKDAGILCDVTA